MLNSLQDFQENEAPNTQYEPSHASEPESKASPKNKRALLVAIALLVAVLIAGAILAYTLLQQPAENETTELTEIVSVDSLLAEGQEELPDNPIDFVELQAVNQEVYAWITVPGTTVDYPICQSGTDDLFYLDHDWEKNYSPPGVPYTEMINQRNFSDPVTLIYAHSGYPDIMFDTLFNFTDETFFATYDTFTIYQPGHIYTYKIVSAYMYDNRHIMNTNNFTDAAAVQEYFALVSDPPVMLKNVRAGVEIGPDDKIVQLSTCMTDETMADNRYLVTGVLIDDQITKAK